jgi:predicted ATPase/class 3 adenylate cyclase/Tfp pilus assembly protein PilF
MSRRSRGYDDRAHFYAPKAPTAMAALHALLLTDVVESTRLTERLKEEEASALWSAHDRVSRDLIPKWRGREIDKTDGLLILFDSVSDAAGYALEYHRALRERGLGIEARAGIHFGPVNLRANPATDIARGAKPVEVDGIALPMAARVMSLARGGQTLLTAAARAALDDVLAGSATVDTHGHYRLKGIAEPVEIFEIGVRDHAPFLPPADAEKAFRVVRTEDGWRPVREVRHNLPRERDAFVGRAADLAAVATKLDAGTRLLTVLGPAGTGKTRLVRRYAWNWLGDWSGGVFFCDLSDARSLEAALFVLALALDVPLGQSDPVSQLGHAIAARGRCLVILDNFEQIVEQAETSVAHWLDRASDAAFLVTSRERLRMAGEDVLPLEPLSIDTEGVELFALRARAQRPDFAITPTNQPIVCRIVELLDGLPLAIELAAARIGVMSPAQLLERLRDRFALLAGAARNATTRQGTLRNAIDWSWNLLLRWEQAALAQCSVFEGGFTLEAAEAVLDLTPWADAPAVVDAVQHLVDKSLLRTWMPLNQTRHELEEPYFGMYWSIHEYAAEKLALSGADVQRAAEERHCRHFARFGSEHYLRSLYRHGGGERRLALMLELDNLVTACKRAVDLGHDRVAVATLRATWEALMAQGSFDLVIGLGARVDTLQAIEASARAAALVVVGRAAAAAGRLEHASFVLSRALELARSTDDRTREADALTWLANAVRQQGRTADAREYAERALELRSALDETDGVALTELGTIQRETGAMDDARATLERALAIASEFGDQDSEINALTGLASINAEQGHPVEARAGFERTLAISRELGDRRQTARALGNLGLLDLNEGRDAVGRQECEAALAIHRDTGDRAREGHVLLNLARLDQRSGRFDEARSQASVALTIAREVGLRALEGSVLRSLGKIEYEQGRLEQARLRYEEALSLHRSVGSRGSAGVTLGVLSELSMQEGRLEEARALLAEGEAHLRAIGERGNLIGLLCLRGRLELAGGQLERAQASLAEASSGAEAWGGEFIGRKDIDELREAIAREAVPTKEKDEVLRRMLSTPPKLHTSKPPATKKQPKKP